MQLIPCDNSFAGAASESLLVLGLSAAAFEALCDMVEGTDRRGGRAGAGIDGRNARARRDPPPVARTRVSYSRYRVAAAGRRRPRPQLCGVRAAASRPREPPGGSRVERAHEHMKFKDGDILR